MNIYKDLEDSLYNVVESLFPDWKIQFAYTNAPEPVNPFCVIDVKKLVPIGREYNTTQGVLNQLTNKIETVSLQDHKAIVRFELIGKADENTTVSEMANQLQIGIRTEAGYYALEQNKLSLHENLSTRRIPVKRDTDMYMVYQLDATFAYTAKISDEIDWINGAGIHGQYYDAGREPDHIITSDIYINYTPNP